MARSRSVAVQTAVARNRNTSIEDLEFLVRNGDPHRAVIAAEVLAERDLTYKPLVLEAYKRVRLHEGWPSEAQATLRDTES